jgi:hypothetical protein
MSLQNISYDVGDDIDTELTSDSSMVQTGQYFYHLQRFRPRLPEDQFHVLIFDDLKAVAR